MEDVKKQRVDFDHVSTFSDTSSEDDGRIIGGPQLLCMLASGTLLCLVGVFITSYGYFVPAAHQHILRAVGPALLVLGLIVLLICIFACLCACHKHRQLPSSFENLDAERQRSSFFYDDLGQDYGSNRPSFAPVLLQHPPMLQQSSAVLQQPPAMLQPPSAMLQQPPAMLQPPPGMLQQPPPMLQQPSTILQQPPAMLHQYNIGQGFTNPTDGYPNAMVNIGTNPEDQPKGISPQKEMMLNPVHAPLFNHSGVYQQTPYQRQMSEQDIASYHLSKQSLLQDPRLHNTSTRINGANPGFEQAQRPQEDSMIVEHAVAGRTASANTYASPVQPKNLSSSNPTQGSGPPDFDQSLPMPIVHSHSTHCVGSPVMMNSYHPIVRYEEHHGYGDNVVLDQVLQDHGLKRVQKVVALNSGFKEDGDDKDFDVGASAGNGIRDRTFSISVPREDGLEPLRLKRNFTVAAPHKRSRARKAGGTSKASRLYRQQTSMPSGSFQHLSVNDYERQNSQSAQMECIEKAFGSMKTKQKSVKDKKKKKNSVQNGPTIVPLPSCSAEVLKEIGVEADHLQFCSSLPSTGSEIGQPEDTIPTRENLRESHDEFQEHDNCDQARSSPESSSSSGHFYTEQETRNFQSKEHLLADTDAVPQRDLSSSKPSSGSKIDIVQKIEEIKERIEILTKEKEKVASQKNESSGPLFQLVNN